MEGKGRDPLPLQVSAHKDTNLMDSLIVRHFLSINPTSTTFKLLAQKTIELI